MEGEKLMKNNKKYTAVDIIVTMAMVGMAIPAQFILSADERVSLLCVQLVFFLLQIIAGEGGI